ncbi:MAG: transporter permease [Thermoproteota archaeon]|nr:transporter permease [Thermoproteota archaeon]
MKRTRLLERIGLALPKSPLGVIIWRELVDALRDRRTIFAAIVIPMILIPITLNMPLFFMSPKQNPPNVALVQLDPNAGTFVNLLNSTEDMTIHWIPASANTTDLVLKNTYDIVVLIPENFTSLVISNKTAILAITFDSTNQRSTIGLSIIQAIQTQYSNFIVLNRLSTLHVDPNLLTPIQIKSTSVRAITSAQAIAGLLIPYFIGILSISAGASFATDTTAGEKERRTLEVYLTMPVSRIKIILGKYLGVSALSLIGVTCQIIGVLLGFSVYTSLYAELVGQTSQSLTLGALNILTIAVSALILSMTGNALLMMVSIFAKSFKEAQQYSSVLTVGLVVPLIVVMYLPPATLSNLIFLPFLGPVTLIRNAIFNIWMLDQLIIGLASSVVYLVIFIYTALRIFSQEKAIFRV